MTRLRDHRALKKRTGSPWPIVPMREALLSLRDGMGYIGRTRDSGQIPRPDFDGVIFSVTDLKPRGLEVNHVSGRACIAKPMG